MARVKIPLVITITDDVTGDLTPVSGAQVSAINRQSSATQPIYPSETTLTPSTQPVTTDTQGLVPGYVDRSPITFTITIPGHSPYDLDWDAPTASDGSIQGAWINDGAVTTAKIAAGAITGAKVADGALSASKLASGTPGQVIVLNSSGVPTVQTISGDFSVSSSGTGSIGTAKVTNSMLAGFIDDAKLLSANNVSWRTLTNTITSFSTGGVPTGRYLAGTWNPFTYQPTPLNGLGAGGANLADSTVMPVGANLWRYKASEVDTVAGKNPQFRVRNAVMVGVGGMGTSKVQCILNDAGLGTAFGFGTFIEYGTAHATSSAVGPFGGQTTNEFTTGTWSPAVDGTDDSMLCVTLQLSSANLGTNGSLAVWSSLQVRYV